MRILLSILIMLLAHANVSFAQLSATPPIGTWESSELVLFASADMNMTYKRTKLVVTAQEFRVTEYVHGTRDLPGTGLNCEIHIRDEWACKYVWEDGNTMRVTRIVKNPTVKIEKFTLGGDANMIKLLKQQGVTSDTYRKPIEQGMNSNNVTFDVTAILVKHRTPDQFVFSYEGVRNATMKRVVEKKTAETPKAETKASEPQAAEAVKPQPADTVAATPVDQPVAEAAATVESKPAPAKDNKPSEVKEKPAPAQSVQEEKSWYTEAWETFLSWF